MVSKTAPGDLQDLVRLLCVLLGLLILGPAAAAGVELAVEPDPPPAGESFRLVFTARGEVREEPDFSPLEESFEILGRNQQTSLSVVNGNYTRISSWVLEVLPREAGTLTVPPITFGDLQSPVTAIRPAPAADVAAGSADDGLFLEAEASPLSPYVQQEVRYTVRLWRRYELSNASLSDPRLDIDALVKPVGEDRQYAAERNGQRYDVVERSFLVFPQASGAARIAPVTVTAQVMERATSMFDLLGRAVKTRRVSSPAVMLEVRPIPAGFPADTPWLPARRLRINELWTPDSPSMRVGEPLTRTLSLWAEGLTSGQLPELAAESPAGLKHYPDQPRLQDTLQQGEHTAVRQEKIAYIAEQPGPVRLPAVEIPWWNTTTDRLEVAQLPARALTAEGSTTQARAAAPPPPPSSPDAIPAPGSSIEVPASTLAASGTNAGWLRSPGWFVLSVLLALGHGYVWLGRRSRLLGTRATGRGEPMAAPGLRDVEQAREAIQRACAINDGPAARAALLRWAGSRWPEDPPRTLGAIAARTGTPLGLALAELDRSRYAAEGSPWEGGALASALAGEPLRPRPPSSLPGVETPLPPLVRLVK